MRRKADGWTLEEFRAHLRHANSPERRYIINFDRGPLFGNDRAAALTPDAGHGRQTGAPAGPDRSELV